MKGGRKKKPIDNPDDSVSRDACILLQSLSSLFGDRPAWYSHILVWRWKRFCDVAGRVVIVVDQFLFSQKRYESV